MARSPYGSGTKPAQRKDGLWVARVEAGWTPEGKRRRIAVSAKTRAECARRLKEVQRRIASEGVPAVGHGRATVKSWSDEWLPRHAEHARPKYFTTDAGHVRKWIVPVLGHRRLADLTAGDLRKLRDAITAPDPPKYPNGRSTTTARAVHALLLRMLKAAMVEGHRVDQRLLLVRMPSKRASDRGALTVPDALAVLEAASRRDDAPRWVAALLQGMRQGEVLGLTWDAVDLDAGTLDVSWQLQPLPYRDKSDHSKGFRVPDGFEARRLTGALHLTRPKTAAGRRTIPLVPWVHASLVAARQSWEPNPWGLVWTSPSGLPIRAEDDRRAWHTLLQEAKVHHPSGRQYHLHEARHTVVSVLLALGVDRSVIQSIVGQSRLVEAYVHVDPRQQRAALEALAARLGLDAPHALEG